MRNVDLFSHKFKVDYDPTNLLEVDPSAIIGNAAGPLATILSNIPKMVMDAITTLLSDPDQLAELLVEVPESWLEPSVYTGLENLGMASLQDLGSFVPGLGTGDILAIAETFIADILAPTNLLPLLTGGFLDLANIPGLPASQIISGAFGEAQLQPLIDAIAQGFGGGTGGTFGDLQTYLATIPGAQQLLDAISAAFGGAAGGVPADITGYLENIPQGNVIGLLDALAAGTANWIDLLTQLTGQTTSSDPLGDLGSVLRDGIFGQIPSWRLGLIPYTSIGDTQPNFLLNPEFLGAASIQGGGIWTWDNTVYRTTNGADSGSAKVVANGLTKVLRSNPINVTAGQQLDFYTDVAWTGLTAGANPIQLGIETDGPTDTVLDTVVLPGSTTSDWTAPPAGAHFATLTGSHTVDPGVTTVVVRLIVNDTVTAGNIWFGDASAKQTGLLEPSWVLDLVPKIQNLDLAGLFDASALTNIANIPAIAQASITNLPADLALLLPAGDYQDLLDGLFDTLQQTSGTTGITLPAVLDAFKAFPSPLVTGVAGPADIGGTAQAIIDQWISGVVGAMGTGASLSDLFNLGGDLSSKATQGQLSWAQLGFRSNKPPFMGLLPTGVSNIPLPNLNNTTVPTIPITATTAAMAYHHIDEPGTKGVVSFQGGYTGTISSFFVNIYRMNPTTGLRTLVHSSPNIAGDIPATNGTRLYTLNNGAGTNTPITVAQGEWYGIEYVVRGTGTYNMVGAASWQSWDHPTVLPKRLASVRDSSVTASPATITEAATTYSANIPFTEFAVSGGASDIHDPELRQFLTAGSGTTIAPTWANYAEVVVVGSGGDGYPGSSTPGIYGRGGQAGVWGTGLMAKGTHFSAGDSFSWTVAAPGGATSSASVNGNTVSGTGGADGSGWGTPTGGASPGDQDYGTPTQHYSGGAAQYTLGGDGSAPGGGGAGGGYGFGVPGSAGTGARGAVFIRFRQ